MLGFLPLFASAESVQIASAPPSEAISPGTVVTFSVSSAGFTDPKYTLSDSYTGSGATTGSIDASGYFTWTPGMYDAGRHTITVTVTDGYNHAASTTVSVLVASNSVFVTAISPGPVIAVGRTITFTAVAPGFVTPSYAVYDSSPMSSLNTGDINSSGAFSWTPANDDVGVHALTVVASDIQGHNAQTQQTITVIAPSVSIRSLQPGSGAGVGSTVSFYANAGQLTSTTTYGVSDQFYGTSTIAASNINSAGYFSWEPTLSDIGLHTIVVTATDAYGNSASTTETVMITASSAVPIVQPATASVPAATTSSATTAASTSAAAATPAVTTAVQKYIFTTPLGIGSRGVAVLQLQQRLLALGYLGGTPTGYFGTLTFAAVKKLQAAHGLARVGSVGPATRAVLNKL